MARYQPLQMQTNTGLKTEIKDFLPVIGNIMPNILLSQFDDTETWVYTATSGVSTAVTDYYNTIRGKGCLKITQTATTATPSVVTINKAFSTPTNIINYGSEQNNQATIIRTGKYGADQDKFWLTLNYKILSVTDSAGWSWVANIYNGTKKASASSGGASNRLYWYKKNIAKLDGGFTYTNGFTLSDFETVTNIEIIFTYTVVTSGAITFFLQDLFTALPMYSSGGNPNNIPNAYYQENTTVNTYFISEIFGNDSNSGLTRALPIRTTEKLVALQNSVFKSYISFMDSEVYSLFDNIDHQAGMTAIADGGFWSEYLETASISAQAGNTSTKRQGARTYYRSRYATSGTVYYVSKAGADVNSGLTPALAKLTIGAAILAAGTSDYIEILDSGVYTESITLGSAKNLSIQAAPKQIPTWQNAVGAFCLYNPSYTALTINIYGINFIGNTIANEKLIYINGTSNILNIEDCTFSKIGLKATVSTQVSAIYLAQQATLNFINNIFIDSSAITGTTKVISYLSPGTETAANNFVIKNNSITLGDTNAVFFQTTGSTYNGNSNYLFANNICYNNVNSSTSGSSEGKFISFTGTAAITVGSLNNITMVYNVIQGKLLFRFPTQKKIILYAYCNLFYGNVSTAFVDFNDAGNALSAGSIVELSNSKFFGSNNTGSGIYMDIGGTAALVIFHNNIFTGFASGLYYAITATVLTSDNNIYYKNAIGALITGTGVTVTSIGIIFQENAIGIQHNGGGSTTISSGYFYLNTADTSGSVTITTKYISNPKIINPMKNNFNLSADSPLNLSGRTIPFIANVNWMSVIGNTGLSMTYNTGTPYPATVTFSDISNFEIGQNGLANITNSNFHNNGIGTLINTLQIYTASINYCIFNNNDCGIFLGLGTHQYNTIINSKSYGVYDGATAQISNNQTQKIFKNNIVNNSGVYDWSSNIITNFCCINSRIPLASSGNIYTGNTQLLTEFTTVGANDITANALLNNTNFMPALKSMGYYQNDVCYLAASTGLNNIGARYINYVKSTLTYNNYIFGSQNSGTADVWAYENPNSFKYSLQPINLNSVRTLDGTYYASPTGYAREFTLSWGNPGDSGRININLKNALEMAFKTFWVIGLTFDNGATYTYYKLKKENNLAMEQTKYLHDILPYGNSSIILIELNNFNINTYLLTTGNMS